MNIDRVVAWFLLLLSGGYVALALRLPKARFGYIGAEVVPLGVGLAAAALAVVLVVQSRRTEGGGSDSPGGLLTVLVLALVVGYVVALERLGFLLTTALFLITVTRLLGYRAWAINTVSAVSFAAAMYFGFTRGLSMVLPRGLLPF